MKKIVFLAGSPSATSRSSFVASQISAQLEAAGHKTQSFSFRDFDAGDLLHARIASPSIVNFLSVVEGASAIVLSTPVYKATYSGGLKLLVDLLPQDGLVGRPALGVATTKLALHGQEVAKAYGSLFAFFRARALEPLVVQDDELTKSENPPFLPAPSAIERAARAVRQLLQALND